MSVFVNSTRPSQKIARPRSGFVPVVAALACAVAFSALAGCGPIRSTMGLVDAERALRDAREAGAEAQAAYPYALAQALLQKAREEQGFNEYERSMELAIESQEYAEEAVRLVASGGVASQVPAPIAPASAPQQAEPAAPAPAAQEPAPAEPETAPADPQPAPADPQPAPADPQPAPADPQPAAPPADAPADGGAQ